MKQDFFALYLLLGTLTQIEMYSGSGDLIARQEIHPVLFLRSRGR
jgi:hypothetical protein